MKLTGYVDGERRFIRDDLTPEDAARVARHISDLAGADKTRLVLFLTDANVVHMIRSTQNPNEVRHA